MRENNNDSNNNDNDDDDDDGLKDVEEMRLLPISNSMNNDIILALHTINNHSSSLSSVDVSNHRILDGTTRTTTTNTTATSTSRSIQEMIDLFLHGYPTNPTP